MHSLAPWTSQRLPRPSTSTSLPSCITATATTCSPCPSHIPHRPQRHRCSTTAAAEGSTTTVYACEAPSTSSGGSSSGSGSGSMVALHAPGATASRLGSGDLSLGPSSSTAPARPKLCCPDCQGRGTQTCAACGGNGRLGRAGYNKRNTLHMAKILNSKWTAMTETLGWRHFRVMQQRKGAGGRVFLLMQASCDPSTQLWVNSQILRERSSWAAGWLSMNEVRDPKTALAPTGGLCQRCSSLGVVPCTTCDSSGVAMIEI